MELIKVSIIIPVYNNEKFLKKCLDSVINQTMSQIEIIIVNDGSTDGSLMILKDYAKSNSKIILLNQENAGQATAINRALNIACGEYIAFIDADDYMEHNMIESLFNEAKLSNVDLVICNWDKVDTDGNILSYHDHSDFDKKIFNRKEIIQEFLLNKKELVEGFSWNKLIKRSIFDEYNIRYPNIKYEDIPTIFKVLTKVNKCKFINKKLYHYVQHNNSITNTKSKKNIIGFIEALQMIQYILIEEKMLPEYKEAYFIYKSNRLLSEYIASRDVVKGSKELSKVFETVLQSLKIKEYIKLNKSKNFKLLVKVLLYKTHLLYLSIAAYQKCKLIFGFIK
ncbi:glycosyltransferase [Bacillus sp. FJAT-29937]|uniref:glycosyltransferase n=1 Tax=Bacillus sp. FJAT-29937 TaxID=1720553 RepID=UPI000835F685|nr:glycosyltransferase [Bacillus sp. FJAT-29937]